MKISRFSQIVIFLGIAILVASIFWPQNIVTSKIYLGGKFIFNPIKSLTGRMALGLGNFFGNLKDINKLDSINNDLEKENKKLRAENINLRELQLENQVLRQQLQFAQENPGLDLIACQVVGRDPNNFLQFITIDKGLNDGLKKDMPVISEGYLVGKIVEIDKKTSKVFLITNPSSAVNALIQSSRATGIVRGELGFGLVIESVIQDVKVKKGDVVVTSGVGGVFPKGLALGEIESVEEKRSDVFQKATIKPYLDFTSLEVVFVIKN